MVRILKDKPDWLDDLRLERFEALVELVEGDED
jgi:hypothetical protein